MTDQNPSPHTALVEPQVQEVLTVIERPLLTPDMAIAKYHKMGPTYELSIQDTEPLIQLSAQTLLAPHPGESVSELSNRLVNNMDRPGLLKDVNSARRLEAAYILTDSVESLGTDHRQYAFGNTILAFIESTHKGIIEDKNSSPAQKAESTMALANVRDQLSRRGMRLTRIELTDQGVRTTTDSEESWRIRSMQGVLKQREDHSQDGVKNGVMFEYVVASLLQFKLWQSEAEDATTFARMARSREDKPAGKHQLEPNIGTRVAHDVVLEVGGERTRIQAKWGGLAHEFGADRYDYSIITEVADTEITGEQMNTLMRYVIAAYKGNDEAVSRVDTYMHNNRGLRSILAK